MLPQAQLIQMSHILKQTDKKNRTSKDYIAFMEDTPTKEKRWWRGRQVRVNTQPGGYRQRKLKGFCSSFNGNVDASCLAFNLMNIWYLVFMGGTFWDSPELMGTSILSPWKSFWWSLVWWSVFLYFTKASRNNVALPINSELLFSRTAGP